MGDLSIFQKGQIFSARLVVASVTSTATLLGTYRTTASQVMTTYTNHGKTSSIKSNSGRKPKLSYRDCRTLKRVVSKKKS